MQQTQLQQTEKARFACSKYLYDIDKRTRYFEHCKACEHQKRSKNSVPYFCSNLNEVYSSWCHSRLIFLIGRSKRRLFVS